MKTLIWLDDCRDPFAPGATWIEEYSPIGIEDVDVIWIDNYAHFIDYLYHNPLPDAICFDHDLGEEKTGYDCAKYLVDLCMNMHLKLPKWAIQSSNPVGKIDIDTLLKNYQKHCE